MKLSGSLLASGAALSLWWTTPVVGAGPRVPLQPSSAAFAPKVMKPSSTLFASPSARVSTGTGRRALPLATRYRDRWDPAGVVQIHRTPTLKRAGLVPLNRFVSGGEAASTAPSRPANGR